MMTIGYVCTMYDSLLMFSIYTTVDACAYLCIFVIITTHNILFLVLKWKQNNWYFTCLWLCLILHLWFHWKSVCDVVYDCLCWLVLLLCYIGVILCSVASFHFHFLGISGPMHFPVFLGITGIKPVVLNSCHGISHHFMLFNFSFLGISISIISIFFMYKNWFYSFYLTCMLYCLFLVSLLSHH